MVIIRISISLCSILCAALGSFNFPKCVSIKAAGLTAVVILLNLYGLFLLLQHIPDFLSVICYETCAVALGFQHMVLEYARNVLDFQDAQSQENDAYASHLFISQLACSLAGRTMKLTFTEDSQISAIYSSLTGVEQYYCNFGVNPEYIPYLKSSSLKVTGADNEGEVRVIELPNHPFFFFFLFFPQARSSSKMPHPIVTAFLKAVIEKAKKNLKDLE